MATATATAVATAKGREQEDESAPNAQQVSCDTEYRRKDRIYLLLQASAGDRVGAEVAEASPAIGMSTTETASTATRRCRRPLSTKTTLSHAIRRVADDCIHFRRTTALGRERRVEHIGIYQLWPRQIIHFKILPNMRLLLGFCVISSFAPSVCVSHPAFLVRWDTMALMCCCCLQWPHVPDVLSFPCIE